MITHPRHYHFPIQPKMATPKRKQNPPTTPSHQTGTKSPAAQAGMVTVIGGAGASTVTVLAPAQEPLMVLSTVIVVRWSVVVVVMVSRWVTILMVVIVWPASVRVTAIGHEAGAQANEYGAAAARAFIMALLVLVLLLLLLFVSG